MSKHTPGTRTSWKSLALPELLLAIQNRPRPDPLEDPFLPLLALEACLRKCVLQEVTERSQSGWTVVARQIREIEAGLSLEIHVLGGRAGLLSNDVAPTVDDALDYVWRLTTWQPPQGEGNRLEAFRRDFRNRDPIWAFAKLGANIKGRINGDRSPKSARKPKTTGVRRGNPGLKPKEKAKMIGHYKEWLDSEESKIADFVRSREYFGKDNVDDAVNYIKTSRKHWKASQNGYNRAA